MIDLTHAQILVRAACPESVCVDCPYQERCVPLPGAEYMREIGLSVRQLADIIRRAPSEVRIPAPEASVDW